MGVGRPHEALHQHPHIPTHPQHTLIIKTHHTTQRGVRSLVRSTVAATDPRPYGDPWEGYLSLY